MSSYSGTQKTPTARPSAGGVPKHSKDNRQYIDIATHLEEFRAYISSAYGLALVGNLKADECFHGIATEEDKHGAKPFRYCVHLDDPQNVYFIDLKRDISGTWFSEGCAPLAPAEREQRRREFEAQRVQREAEILARHTKAAERARAMWHRSLPACPSHPYLSRKGVDVHGIRYLPIWQRRVYDEAGNFETVKVEGVLLIPMRDETGILWNAQAIFPKTCPALGRDKDFLPGGRKKGLFHWIGRRTDTVCLAEGYATGATIHEATGYRVVVCFDAGNMPVVAEIVRGLLPAARIVVCADNDEPDKNGRRAGQEKAEEAAALVGGYVALPPVEGADFNDFAQMLKAGVSRG